MSIGNWYRVGTVAVTNGSVNVVGTGTFWTSQCNPGDRFTVDGENWYEVNTITDDTHLALLSVGGSGAFAGTTASNVAYAIDRNFTNNLNANIAASVASLVAQYQANSNGPLAGLFGNGAAATPGIAFLNEASTGLFHPATGSAALAVQGAEFLRAVGTAAGVPAMLGLGLTAPANALDVFTTNNALYGARIQNGSAGTSARAALQIGNTSAAAQVLNLGVNGASFTTNGVLSASRGFVEGPNGVDCASAVTSGTAFSWGVGTNYVQKMSMDNQGFVSLASGGRLGIGMAPTNVLDITQNLNGNAEISLLNSNSSTAAASALVLTNGTSSTVLVQYGADYTSTGINRANGTQLQAGGVGGLTLASTSAQPIYVAINSAQVAEFDAGGNFLIGTSTPAARFTLGATTDTTNGMQVNATSTGNAFLNLNSSGGSNFILSANNSGSAFNGIASGTVGLASSMPITVSNGTSERMRLDTNGRLGIGVIPSNWGGAAPSILQIGSLAVLASYNAATLVGFNHYYNGTNDIYQGTGFANKYLQVGGTHVWQSAPSGTAGGTVTFTSVMELDTSGNLLVGATSGGNHVISKAVTNDAGSPILNVIGGSGVISAVFYGVSALGANAGNSASKFNRDAVTGYSIRSAGVNAASGADYAEYRQVIPSLYGAVAKGALLGYDATGLMTNVFANVVGRVLPKSTLPSYVGNDTWGTEAAIVAAYGVTAPDQQPATVAKPAAPTTVVQPTAPAAVADPGPDATTDQANAYVTYLADLATYDEQEAAYEAYVAAETAYTEQLAAYTAYVAAEATYQANLTAFNAALETERVKWDRIALCGVVPVNIAGLTAADIGKYLVPCAAADGTITASAVAKGNLTLGQYIDSLGTIEMIGADGRPLVNVKTG